jgi:hypothetical protein
VLANAKGLEFGADETGYWAAKAIKSCIDRGYIYSHGEINLENYEQIITREEAVAALQMASGRGRKEGMNVTLQDIPDGTQMESMECPECHQHTIVMKEGCLVCSNCGYSKCGG